MKITNREQAEKHCVEKYWDDKGLERITRDRIVYEFDRGNNEEDIDGYRVTRLSDDEVSIEDIANVDIIDAISVESLVKITKWCVGGEIDSLTESAEALGNQRDNALEQLQTVHEHVGEACQILGLNVKDNMCDSWSLVERCREKMSELESARQPQPVDLHPTEHANAFVQVEPGLWKAVRVTPQPPTPRKVPTREEIKAIIQVSLDQDQFIDGLFLALGVEVGS